MTIAITKVHAVHLIDADSAMRPPTLKSSQPTGSAVSQPLTPFIVIIPSPKADTHFTVPRKVKN